MVGSMSIKRGLAVAVCLLLFTALAACGGTDGLNTGGSQATGGTAGAGGNQATGGSGGADTGGVLITGGTAGLNAGGSQATGGAASGGATGMGGTAGAGGTTSASGPSSAGGNSSTSAGGTAGSGVSPGATACPTPTAPLITDFTYTPTGATVAPTEATFGDFKTTFSGGTYIYPDSTAVPQPAFALTSDITASNWHISGTVGTYSGFGLYWNACVLLDASAFKGIVMTISGWIPPPNTLYMAVGTAEDTISTAWYERNSTLPITPTLGRCNPPGSSPYDGSCISPSKAIPVSPTPTVVRVLWSDLVGGKPLPSVTPSQLTGISFYFNYTSSSAPYPVDIAIDDLFFVL
jgi:hypothetical protein